MGGLGNSRGIVRKCSNLLVIQMQFSFMFSGKVGVWVYHMQFDC